MSNLTDYQLPPPSNWEHFEDLCWDLWKLELEDQNTTKNGRRGQTQNGVDVCGRRKCDGNYVGVQCKGKDNYTNQKLTISELRKEVDKAKLFRPKLNEFILATTAPKDAKIEEEARKLTKKLKTEWFSVHVFGWTDILARLDSYPALLAKYFTHQTSFIEYQNDQLLNSQLNTVRDLLNSHLPIQAITQLTKIRDAHWATCSNKIKYRITTQFGISYELQNNTSLAANYFIEALQFNPDDEDAKCRAAQGHLISDDIKSARELIRNILKVNPLSISGNTLKVIATPKSKPISSITKSIHKALQSNPRIQFSLAHIARDKAELDTAEDLLTSALKNTTEAKEQYQRFLADILMTKLQKRLALIELNQATAADREYMDSAHSLYSEVISAYTNKEMNSSLAEAHSNRCFCRRLKGNHKDAISDIEIAIQLDPKNPRYAIMRAHLAKDVGDTELARTKFEELLPAVSNHDALLGLAATYHESGMDLKALEVLSSQAFLDLSDSTMLESSLLKIRALLNCDREAEALAEISRISKKAEAKIIKHLCMSWVYAKRGNTKDCIETLGEAAQCIDQSTPVHHIARVAEAFFSYGDYQNAMMLYNYFVNRDQFTQYSKKLLFCMYKCEKMSTVVKFCKTLRKNGYSDAFIIEIEASVYIQMSAINELRTLCLDYLANNPSDLHIRLLLLQNGGEDLPDHVINHLLESEIDLNKVDMDDAIAASHLFSHRGFFEIAVELAYRIRKKYFKVAKAHLSYVMLFFKRPNDRNDWINYDSVSIDCSVLCRDKRTKQETWYTIVSEDCDPLAGEYDAHHPISKSLLNMRRNQDVLIRKDSFGEVVVEILDIRHKFVYAFNQSCEHFQTWFPDVPGLWKINVGSTEKEMKEAFDIIRQSLERSEKDVSQAVEFYSKGAFTLGSVCRVTNSNMLDVWSSLVRQPKVGIRSCNFYNYSIENSNLKTIEDASGFVLDIVSLITLNALKSLEDIKNLNKPIVVTETTVDELKDKLDAYKASCETGIFSLGVQGGQLVRSKVTGEQVRKLHSELSYLVDWAKDRCVSVKEAEILTHEGKNEISRLIGTSSLDSALVARGRKFILVSDDERFRSFAFNEFKVVGVWSQPILQFLFKAGEITEEKYSSRVVELIALNYRFTSVDEAVLYNAAVRSNMLPIGVFNLVSHTLQGHQTDLSAVAIAVRFFKKILLESVLSIRREQLILHVLGMLFMGRSSKDVYTKLGKCIESEFLLIPAHKNELIQIIKSSRKLHVSF
ncbi:MAG: hypothetical protein HS116_17430 [Planctomycetes bacterium]|nr:hypothetical protein [Planctomycetota bacterium]